MKNRFRIGLGLLLAFGGDVWAQNPQIGLPSYSGDGCAPGSASAALTSDGTTLSILYDGFHAEAGGTTGTNMQRRSCKMTIPVQVPRGFQVSISEVDYRGFISIPQYGYSQFTVQYGQQGYLGPRIFRRFTGPIDKDLVTVNRLRVQDLHWSACGQNVSILVDTSVVVLTNNKNEQSMVTIDSADLQGGAGVTYQLQWRECQGR